jgi:hypothetical protein
VDEAEGLIESSHVFRRALEDDRAAKKQEDDQEKERDDTDTYMETIFGRRRPDSIAVEWSNKVIYILEFKFLEVVKALFASCPVSLSHKSLYSKLIATLDRTT